MNISLFFNRFLPAQDCLLCGAASASALLCPACHANLPRTNRPCPRCAAPGTQGNFCGQCLRHPPSFDATHAALEYTFPVDKLIQRLKYGGQLAIARLLGELLHERVGTLPLPDRVLALPLHPSRLRMRGFNQAYEIAKALNRKRPLPLSTEMAQRIVDTAAQAELPLDARQKNMRGAFACTLDLTGQRIAVVDDVMTSGATLNEVAKTLKQAGASEVQLWLVARAALHR